MPRDAVGGERQMCPESSPRPRMSIADGHCVGPGAGGLDLTCQCVAAGVWADSVQPPRRTARVSVRAAVRFAAADRVLPDPERRAPAGTASGRSGRASPARDPETAALDPDSPVRVPESVGAREVPVDGRAQPARDPPVAEHRVRERRAGAIRRVLSDLESS